MGPGGIFSRELIWANPPAGMELNVCSLICACLSASLLKAFHNIPNQETSSMRLKDENLFLLTF